MTKQSKLHFFLRLFSSKSGSEYFINLCKNTYKHCRNTNYIKQ